MDLHSKLFWREVNGYPMAADEADLEMSVKRAGVNGRESTFQW